MFEKILPALKVAVIYLIFSLLWIFTSDNVVASIANDKETLNFLQTIKGWVFVTFTSILIFIFTNKYIKAEQQLNNKLQKKKDELEAIIDSLPIPIVIHNDKGEALHMSKMFMKLTGYSFEEVDTLQKASQTLFGNNAQIYTTRIEKTFSNTQTADIGEFVIQTKEKNELTWHFFSSPLGTLDNQKIFLIAAIDMTKLKEQSDLIIQQSKMAALGEMIENIAHQWRQPLSTISALSTGIQLKNEMNDLGQEYIDSSMKTINDNTQYLSNTINDFRNFFDKEKVKRYIKIDDVVNKAVELIKPRVINHDIEVVIQAENIEINSFENELIQVVINILNNAIDALKDTSEQRLIIVKTKKESRFLLLSIQDSAGGIPEKIIPHIFEPYFTTKKKDHGTGIGLFMSEEIISKHCKGQIEAQNSTFVYNAQDFEGANFIIRLPLQN